MACEESLDNGLFLFNLNNFSFHHPEHLGFIEDTPSHESLLKIIKDDDELTWT